MPNNINITDMSQDPTGQSRPGTLQDRPCAAVPDIVDEKHTYRQILKSSALIGGSSLISVVIGIVRTKAFALLLGPTGVGLMGLYGLTCTFFLIRSSRKCGSIQINR